MSYLRGRLIRHCEAWLAGCKIAEPSCQSGISFTLKAVQALQEKGVARTDNNNKDQVLAATDRQLSATVVMVDATGFSHGTKRGSLRKTSDRPAGRQLHT